MAGWIVFCSVFLSVNLSHGFQMLLKALLQYWPLTLTSRKLVVIHLFRHGTYTELVVISHICKLVSLIYFWHEVHGTLVYERNIHVLAGLNDCIPKLASMQYVWVRSGNYFVFGAHSDFTMECLLNNRLVFVRLVTISYLRYGFANHWFCSEHDRCCCFIGQFLWMLGFWLSVLKG